MSKEDVDKEVRKLLRAAVAECAPDWDDIKEQWESGDREEEEDGQRDQFFAAYQAHIASGGQGTDKVLYQL
jgi:hemerythrin-like domain-containing protein